jgi:phage terminase large subunit
MEVIHVSGAVISVKGADLRADDLSGGAYRLIVCDEYALWKKPEVKELILAPMLVDYDGQFLFGSTKRGKNHFWKLHNEAKANPDKYHASEADMWDNPFISEKGRQKVISEYPGGEANPLYQQEVKNKYVVFSGQVFALESGTYTEKRWDPADFDHAYHWRGMDHGFSPDPTACVWIAYNARKGYFQVYSEYKQEKLLIHQHAEIIARQERWKVIDTHSDIDPQVMAEYGNVGLDLTAAKKTDKKAQLLALVNALRIGRVKIADCCTQLLDEMNSLTWENVEKEDGEDHLIDAFQYGFNNLVVPTVSDDDDDDDLSTNSKQQQFNRQDFGD